MLCLIKSQKKSEKIMIEFEIINNYFSGQNKIKDVKLWFNKSKGMSKDIFSDQNWDSSIKLISQNEI